MRYRLEYEVGDSDTEATAKPVWFIVITSGQRLVKKELFPYEIMNRITGPFKSRASAERHRKSREYHYGKDSIVFCQSCYYSDLEEVKQ